MLNSLKLQTSIPSMGQYQGGSKFIGNMDARRTLFFFCSASSQIRLRQFSSLALQSKIETTASLTTSGQSLSSAYIPAIGSPSMPSSSPQLCQWNITERHITILNVMACAVAISTTWLFCSAIPAVLAFKRTAESLEKLMDVTREELPGTMAAIRLSGMEISDLTMELSDLGQGITQGVRNSSRAVRIAEERLRRVTNMAPPASLQTITSPRLEPNAPALAKTARGLREGIVKGRAILQMLFSLVQFSRFTFNFLNRCKMDRK